jgi:hypothetical protein
MAKYKHYNLRETCPNPAGGAYRDVTPEQMDRNVDVVMEETRNAFERKIIPLLLEIHMGDVHKVAACIATLAATALHDFMEANTADGQRKNLRIYDEMSACLTGACSNQQEMALAVALGLDPEMIAKGEVKIFTI